ncbi:hypothetical protein SteCoe_3694 [Stentor coeruleus]|uniref:Uncharacterized protein n=1 Tax=Stentor coeruleus TaxID=5963 RepID=A0A1R2CWK4_9CILI|nr:hypothetical protein SteCoe_3694 [Stentor coeruleus]
MINSYYRILSNSTNTTENITECSHGDKISDKITNFCTCDWGWYSDLCDKTGKEVWGKAKWNSFLYSFIILYGLVFLIAFIKLYSTLNQDKIIGVKRFFYRLFRSPKNLCLVYICSIGILRLFWLVIDPLCFNERIERTADRLLYETVYPFIYGLYSSVLLVWGGLYQGMRPKRSDPFRILRKLIMIMMVIAFPISITISCLKGYRIRSDIWMPLAIIFVGSGTILMVVGFIIFGILLFIYVERSSKKVPEYNKPDSNFEEFSITIREDDSKSRRSFSRKLSFAPRLKKIKVEELDNSWDQYMSHEHQRQEMKMSEKFMYDEENTKLKIKTKDTSNGLISMITDDDRIIFRKLCLLFFISIILGIMVLVFLSILASDQHAWNSSDEFNIMCTVFALEIFACAMIYMVFTAQIKVKDKSALRFFTIVSMKMADKLPKIKYPSELKFIGTRLHNFYL